MKIDLRKVRIGSDFEMFLTNNEGKFISAIPFIEGTKDSPQQLTNEGHAIQHDGALLEGNVPPVSLEEGDLMWENIQMVIDAFRERTPGLLVRCCPNGEYEDSELMDEEARIFGCDPDFNAWKGGDINKKPNAETTNKRCCGFHFHFSFPGADPSNVMRLIRILDARVGLPMLFEDEDRERRKLYGKAGCFRFKDYGGIGGVEYRTLSNAVAKDKDTFDQVWASLKEAITEYNKGKDYMDMSDPIQEAINDYNLDLAAEISHILEIPLYGKVTA